MMFNNKLKLENGELKLEIAKLEAQLEMEKHKNSVLELKLERAEENAEKAQRYFDTISAIRGIIDRHRKNRNGKLNSGPVNKIGF